jgi:hypothetical protein
MSIHHPNSPEFSPTTFDREGFNAEIRDAAVPTNLVDLIDILVDRLPATPEPERPSWLPQIGTPIKVKSEIIIDSDGNVTFGEDYTQRDIKISDINLTFARHEERPNHSQIVIRVPRSEEFAAYHVWYKLDGDGAVRRELKSTSGNSDFLPHANRKLNEDETQALIDSLFSIGIDNVDLENLVKPTEEDYQLLSKSQAEIDVVHAELQAAYEADEENRRQAAIDSQGIILR